MKKTIILLSICLMQFTLVAQTSLNGAGGDATGIGGEMSFSIGEVVYTSISNSNFTFTQGVQQPYISPFNYSVNASDYNVCAGQAVTLSVNTVGSYRAGTVHCNATPTAVVDVTNPITGKTWMDRNLGASQVATSATDVLAYGDLYQWGRGADGHQCRNSATTTIVSSSDQPGNGNFIKASSSPYEWCSPLNINLWQGVNGINNPCPSGYRIPSVAEMDAERLSWSTSDGNGAFASTPLKFTFAGYRNWNGTISNTEGDCSYWLSDFSNSLMYRLTGPYYGFVGIGAFYSALGGSVRCIKDNFIGPIGFVNSIDCSSIANIGNLTSGTTVIASSVVSYEGGNGGSYTGQTILSEGVTGLTATLNSGTFANGSGNLAFTILGTPTSSGIASFILNIGGETCILNREVINGVQSGITAHTCGSTDIHNSITNYGTVTDQEGNIYKTIFFGVQEWMAENLKTTIYQNGDPIPNVPNGSDWSNLSAGAWVNYDNNDQIECSLGKLYNWYTVNDSRNVCPTGWHIPSDDDWNYIINYFGTGNFGPGGKMKSAGTQFWLSPNTGATNQTGFSALPAGNRNSSGSFSGYGNYGYYWSTWSDHPSTRHRWELRNTQTILAPFNVGIKDGYSIRCIKN
jgi:uncharacterized protein (TIGR02145 family)